MLLCLFDADDLLIGKGEANITAASVYGALRGQFSPDKLIFTHTHTHTLMSNSWKHLRGKNHKCYCNATIHKLGFVYRKGQATHFLV